MKPLQSQKRINSQTHKIDLKKKKKLRNVIQMAQLLTNYDSFQTNWSEYQPSIQTNKSKRSSQVDSLRTDSLQFRYILRNTLGTLKERKAIGHSATYSIDFLPSENSKTILCFSLEKRTNSLSSNTLYYTLNTTKIQNVTTDGTLRD